MVKKRYPDIDASVLDLPEVVSEAKNHTSDRHTVRCDRYVSLPLPQDVELFSLVRVLHDHDDEPVLSLLTDCMARSSQADTF
jgi:demethylspheroidene O-methyltransferase